MYVSPVERVSFKLYSFMVTRRIRLHIPQIPSTATATSHILSPIPFCQMVLFKAASRCCQCSVCSKIFHTQARAGALHTKGKCSSIVRCCICRISNELEPSESDSEQASTQVMILFTSQLIRFNMPFNSISGPLIPPVICVGDYSRTVRP